MSLAGRPEALSPDAKAHFNARFGNTTGSPPSDNDNIATPQYEKVETVTDGLKSGLLQIKKTTLADYVEKGITALENQLLQENGKKHSKEAIFERMMANPTRSNHCRRRVIQRQCKSR